MSPSQGGKTHHTDTHSIYIIDMHVDQNTKVMNMLINQSITWEIFFLGRFLLGRFFFKYDVKSAEPIVGPATGFRRYGE